MARNEKKNAQIIVRCPERTVRSLDVLAVLVGVTRSEMFRRLVPDVAGIGRDNQQCEGDTLG